MKDDAKEFTNDYRLREICKRYSDHISVPVSMPKTGDEKGYEVTAEFERDHWWFRSRRDLVLAQVRKALSNLGEPTDIRILDYGCGTGFNLASLAEYGEVSGADAAPEALKTCVRSRPSSQR